MTQPQYDQGIFGFDDPIQYLRDCYRLEKERDSEVTWTTFARKIGISASMFKMLLSGQRKLSLTQLHGIAARLKLHPAEHAYFEAMVLLHQSNSPEERGYYVRRLQTLRTQQGELRRLKLSSRMLTVEWFVPALLVYLLDVVKIEQEGFEALDIEKVSKALGIEADVLTEAIEKIRAAGILREAAGKSVMVTLDSLVSAVSSKRFVRLVSEVSLERLKEQFGSGNTFFYATALSLGPGELREFVHDYKELMEKYVGRPRDKTSELEVFQTLLHMWPVGL